ncbi:magnesium and cobalt transport protein CorA [Kribbella sp. NPDC056951]|uniref:magnesium and cobalt transport protein CorA n=1 Tax=Kribbella sp. NPDC056951 TaxID=3345978 RepID=UPI003628E1AE
MAVVDNAVYVEGSRACEPDSLEDTYELLRDRDGMGWIGLYRPDAAEIESVAKEFGIHRLAVHDTVSAHQRPKLERYQDVLFTVLRPGRYLDDVERVEYGELHVFTGKDFVVTVRHAETPDLGAVRRRLEGTPELLRLGPEAVLYAILDQVVDEYVPVVDGLQTDIDEIEDQVFSGDPEVSRRIYHLLQEVVKFERASQPLPVLIADLRRGFDKYEVDPELQGYLRDVSDHVERIVDRVTGFRVLLVNLIGINAGLIGQRQNEETQRLSELSLRQNEEVKRISSWAAILFAPTLVASIYGMNFTQMPELGWQFGYPLALVLMVLTGLALHRVFKRRGWL